MKKLGEGWQYETFDLGNGRVFKKFHPFWKRCFVIFRDRLFGGRAPLSVIPRYARSMKEKATASILIIKECGVDRGLFGNPTFTDGLEYTQDKVVPLHDALAGSEEAHGKEIIERFICCILELRAGGVIDKSFNIGKNFGISGDDNVILIDIGELVTGEEDISAQIGQRPWTKPYVLEAVPQGLRGYFTERMDATFLPK